MCRVSLKDRRCSVDLYNLLGVQSVADVVRYGRLRWFGHLEHKDVDDWVSACRNVVVAGSALFLDICLKKRCRNVVPAEKSTAGRGARMWNEETHHP